MTRWFRRPQPRRALEGRLARERAEKELEALRRQTREIASQTPRYAALGEELREIHQVRNGLAEAFLEAARRRA